MTKPLPLLQVIKLKQKISGKEIVKNVSFDAQAGEVTVFLGPNGAGKTTLLKSVIGLCPLPKESIDSQILLNGVCIDTLPVHERVSKGLLYVPQHTSLFRNLTVKDNLQLIYDYHPYWQQQERAFFTQERDRLLNQIEVTPTLDTYARNLSGGQQRKIEIIRALLMHPQAILFDEPFAGVDPKSIYELKKLFTQMAEQGIAVIISDHHVDQLLSIAHSIYVIISGEVVTYGSIKDIMSNQELKERYLGSQFHAEVAERFLG